MCPLELFFPNLLIPPYILMSPEFIDSFVLNYIHPWRSAHNVYIYHLQKDSQYIQLFPGLAQMEACQTPNVKTQLIHFSHKSHFSSSITLLLHHSSQKYGGCSRCIP